MSSFSQPGQQETRTRWFPAPALRVISGKWADGFEVTYTSPEVPDGLIRATFTVARSAPAGHWSHQFKVMMSVTWSVPSRQWGHRETMEADGFSLDLSEAKSAEYSYASALLNGRELEPLPGLPSGAHALTWDGCPFTQRWL